jgi:hypothetical protein
MQNMEFPNAAKHALLALTPTFFVNETMGKQIDILPSYVRLVAIVRSNGSIGSHCSCLTQGKCPPHTPIPAPSPTPSQIYHLHVCEEIALDVIFTNAPH